MKTHESLREDVSRMVEMQKRLDASGGPENPANATLFQDYGNLRNGILEFFRLPYNFDHGWLCYARVTDTDFVTSRVMDRIIFGTVAQPT